MPLPNEEKASFVICPPAYDPAVSTTYVEGSEVEAYGRLYRCNPFPYAIYCTISSFRPQSLDNMSWEDIWEEIDVCIVPTSRPSVVPSRSRTEKVSQKLLITVFFYAEKSLSIMNPPIRMVKPTQSPTEVSRNNLRW